MVTINQHINNPVLASVDILSLGVLATWWLDAASHPIGTISTLLAGIWYAYLIFEAIEKRWKRRRNKDE